MLTCRPDSLFRWNFHVLGTSGGSAHLTFDFFGEQGAIRTAEGHFSVRKHGALSGHWTLESAGRALAHAQKVTPLMRTFRIVSSDGEMMLQAHGAFTRCFDILVAGARVGTIEPAHLFTREARVQCSSAVPERLQLFAFWLAVITWRRASRNS